MTPLQAAAQAVLDRWDAQYREWKDEGPAADLMHALRGALAAEASAPNLADKSAQARLAAEWGYMRPSKPLTQAQTERLYRNLGGRHDAVSLAGFRRIVVLVEHAHKIRRAA